MSKPSATVRHTGTNLSTMEEEEIELRVAAADELLRARRVKVLRQIDEEDAYFREKLEANAARRAAITGVRPL